MVDRLGGEEKPFRNVSAAEAGGNESEHLNFTRGEVRRVLARRRTRTTAEAAHAARPQAARNIVHLADVTAAS